MIQGRVWQTCMALRHHRLDLCQAGDTIREFLYPRIELGLAFSNITKAQLDKWTSVIRRAVLHGGLDNAQRSVNTDALFCAMGVRTVREEYVVIHTNEFSVSLRSDSIGCATTGASRLCSSVRAGRIRTAPLDTGAHALTLVTAAKRSRRCRASRAIGALLDLGVSTSWFQARGATIDCHGPLPERLSDSVAAFTDGSHTRGQGGGYAAVFFAAADVLGTLRDPYVAAGPAPLAGANYAAEVRAVLTALDYTVDTDVYTDCASAVEVLSKDLVPLGKRLRLGARSLVMGCRLKLALRRALGLRTRLYHVPAHTGSGDTRSRGNAIADRVAGQARGRDAPPHLDNEEHYVFWHKSGSPGPARPRGLTHVSGNLRKLLCQLTRDRMEGRWAALPTQGRTIHMCAGQLSGFLDYVRRTKDGALLLFLLQMSTGQTSTPDRNLWGASRHGSALLCPLCGRRTSPAHPFTCPGNSDALAQLRRTVSDATHAAVTTLLDTGATSQAHQSACSDFARHARWFDPACPPRPHRAHYGSQYLGHCPPLEEAFLDIEQWDRWAGLCGLLPDGLVALLSPHDVFLSCTDVVAKRVRELMADAISTLRVAILKAARTAFCTWSDLYDARSEDHTDPARPPPPWLHSTQGTPLYPPSRDSRRMGNRRFYSLKVRRRLDLS